MKILVTGANGFIGKNISVRLRELPDMQIETFVHEDKPESLQVKTTGLDAVIHLAGVNRPEDDKEFDSINHDLTRQLCEALKENESPVHVLFASSIQVEKDNPYGNSKRAAELELEKFSKESGSPVTVFRLPNVFGKWCRPEYNSVVATFCYQIARSHKIDIHDESTQLKLVYIDDVFDAFYDCLKLRHDGYQVESVEPAYCVTLGELAKTLRSFSESRQSLFTDNVGSGFKRALYATYLSYQEPDNFSYKLKSHNDNRGRFVEILKTKDNGQFSYFTAKPGISRGSHYHHTKNEKFLVVKGDALIRFKNIVSGEYKDFAVSSENPEIVETIPGWAHDITNTGSEELVVFVWANEYFDNEFPDTIGSELDG